LITNVVSAVWWAQRQPRPSGVSTMNSDERQGDANPISDREKRNTAARDLRVQSQVHLVMPSPPTLSHPSVRDKERGKQRPARRVIFDGDGAPERRLCSIRTEAGGRRRERRRGRAELPRRCSPPRWRWSGVVEQSQAGRRIPTTSGDIARALLPRLDQQGSGGARPSSVPNGVAAARRPHGAPPQPQTPVQGQRWWRRWRSRWGVPGLTHDRATKTAALAADPGGDGRGRSPAACRRRQRHGSKGSAAHPRRALPPAEIDLPGGGAAAAAEAEV